MIVPNLITVKIKPTSISNIICWLFRLWLCLPEPTSRAPEHSAIHPEGFRAATLGHNSGIRHKSLLDGGQVLQLLGDFRVPERLFNPPVDPLVPLVMLESHVLEEVILLAGCVAAVLVSATIHPEAILDV